MANQTTKLETNDIYAIVYKIVTVYKLHADKTPMIK